MSYKENARSDCKFARRARLEETYFVLEMSQTPEVLMDLEVLFSIAEVPVFLAIDVSEDFVEFVFHNSLQFRVLMMDYSIYPVLQHLLPELAGRLLTSIKCQHCSASLTSRWKRSNKPVS